MSEPGNWIRARSAPVLHARDALVLVGPDASVRRLEGDTAALAEALLAHCETRPRTLADLRAFVEAETGAPLGESRVVDELVTMLAGSGALERSVLHAPLPKVHARVIVAATGAVAAAEIPRLVGALQALGMEVRVIATERALRFVSREALEALTHLPVPSSTWAEQSGMRVPHVELAAWADLVVVWPATATTIGRIATGDCSELVSAVAVTTKAPVIVAPSMNEAMLDAAAVARNLETLRADGFLLTATTLAHEVADAPDERREARGGAPSVEMMVRLAHGLARATIPAEPRDAAGWEAFHRRVPESEQAWTGEADAAVMDAIASYAPASGSVWDVGTGHGAIAIACAARGMRVIATDVSETAIARASTKPGADAVVWMRDDVTATGMRGRFDAVVDRGTLHVLPALQRAAWADAIRRVLRPGGVAIVTVHAPPGDPRARSHPMTDAEVLSILGAGAFELVAATPDAFAGRLSPPIAATTCVLRRRS